MSTEDKLKNVSHTFGNTVLPAVVGSQTKYRTIVADPPWKYGKWAAPTNRKMQEYDMPYETMSVEAIKALNVADLADENCELYLWTTQKYLPDAFGGGGCGLTNFQTLCEDCHKKKTFHQIAVQKMIENSTEQYKVSQKILEMFKDRFDILINIDKEDHFIGTLFPDIVFVDKKTKAPLFIIEIKKNGRISICMNAWKSAPVIPATLYIIVPESELQNAKSIAAVTGVKSRFGYYTLDKNGDVLKVVFE